MLRYYFERHGKMRKATIQMVADAAGVSRGTVDRVIHNRSYVSSDVRLRIIEAMQELQYNPMHIADKTSLHRTRLIRLGIIIPTWSEFFNEEVIRGVQSFKKDYQSKLVDVQFRICKTDLPNEVLQAIDDLLRAGVEGLAIATQDNEILRKRVGELANSGFPVILYNSDITNCPRLLYVGPDVPKTGRVAGGLMNKMVSRNARLLVILGSEDIFSHRERANGFTTQLLEYGFSMEQIHVVSAFNDYVAFQRIVEEFQKNPKIEGIYLAYDVSIGCLEALESLGLTGRIRLIVHDLTNYSRKLLEQRKIDFIIDQNIFLESYLSLRLLKEHIQDPSIPIKCDEFSPIQIFCTENLQENGD